VKAGFEVSDVFPDMLTFYRAKMETIFEISEKDASSCGSMNSTSESCEGHNVMEEVKNGSDLYCSQKMVEVNPIPGRTLETEMSVGSIINEGKSKELQESVVKIGLGTDLKEVCSGACIDYLPDPRIAFKLLNTICDNQAGTEWLDFAMEIKQLQNEMQPE